LLHLHSTLLQKLPHQLMLLAMLLRQKLPWQVQLLVPLLQLQVQLLL
jgi:hypothetical protein